MFRSAHLLARDALVKTFRRPSVNTSLKLWHTIYIQRNTAVFFPPIFICRDRVGDWDLGYLYIGLYLLSSLLVYHISPCVSIDKLSEINNYFLCKQQKIALLNKLHLYKTPPLVL